LGCRFQQQRKLASTNNVHSGGEDNSVNYFAFYADGNANNSFDSDAEPTIQFHELIGTGIGAILVYSTAGSEEEPCHDWR
jgi:hypothetical protein